METGMEFEWTSSATASPDVLMQEFDGESVLLDLRSGQYLGLDELGTRIWQLLQTGSSFSRIAELLLEEYEVDQNQLRHDIDVFIGQLLQAGLIQVSENPEAKT